MAKIVEGRTDKLLKYAAEEFLEMGYQEASLRVIAAKAGTTTGSIYSRFGDKAGLFQEIVNGTMEELVRWFETGQQSFADKPAEEKSKEIFTYRPELWDELVEYIYSHYDIFRVLVRCTDNDCFQKMVDRIIEIEVRYTYQFLETTKNDAISQGRLTPMLLHILSGAFYYGIFESVRHEMPMEEALVYVRQLRRFFETLRRQLRALFHKGRLPGLPVRQKAQQPQHRFPGNRR